uniref:Reverse transcriptase zinc-binding domain-containing protein n=1 Tax=Arion vulgaris TaxID=1028688 RepID=A0A0B7BSN7_9EUPU
MGLRDSAACTCGAPKQSPEHILQDCPSLSSERLEIWPTETTLQDKLWGTGEDLKRTALFMSQNGVVT